MSAIPTGEPGPCERLDWDSRFFGFSVARVRGGAMTPALSEAVDAWCASEGISCLYFVARADDPCTTRTAEDAGFRLVDLRMTFEQRIRAGATDLLAAAGLRPARPEDLPVLRPIARVSYRHTRFHFDEHMPKEASDRLYEVWLDVSVGGWAEEVLVVESDGRPSGYITCHLHRERSEGSIGLVGVAESGRGRGLGRRLVEGALGWFASKGLESVSVVTQGRNVAAQRLFQQCGFLTRSIELYYHKWYRSGSTTGE